MSQPSGVHPLLLDDHHLHIERVCVDLLSDTYADDPRALCARWRQFEAVLLDHMRAEEELILPGYEQVAPAEVSAIREDHRKLREVLQRLGVEVELHQIRAHTVQELVERLREHAEREDAAMYPWAAQHLSSSGFAALRARIEGWLGDVQSLVSM